jgi:hypothetical protein
MNRRTYSGKEAARTAATHGCGAIGVRMDAVRYRLDGNNCVVVVSLALIIGSLIVDSALGNDSLIVDSALGINSQIEDPWLSNFALGNA